MTPEFIAKLEAKLLEFHTWSRGRNFSGLRLVQYCGVEMIGAHDINLNEIDDRISGYVREGFYVGWAEQSGRLYLCVWEYPGPVPPWPRVFAEEDLDDECA